MLLRASVPAIRARSVACALLLVAGAAGIAQDKLPVAVEVASLERAPLIEATAEAAALRLRPILMTAGAMVLGAVPLAIAAGAGAESRQDIGWVIVGGTLVGTFFTLFVIPVVYTYVARKVAVEAEPAAIPAHQGEG